MNDAFSAVQGGVRQEELGKVGWRAAATQLELPTVRGERSAVHGSSRAETRVIPDGSRNQPWSLPENVV